jgi:hypothetical protein
MKDIRKLVSGMPQWEINQVLSNILPGGRGKVLLQAYNSVVQYGGKLEALNNPLVSLNESYKAQSHTMAGELHRAWAQIQSDIVQLGNALMPLVQSILPPFLSIIRGVVQAITGLPGIVKDIVAGFAIFMATGGPLLIFLGSLFRAWAAIRDVLYAIRGAGEAAAVGEEAAAAAGKASGAAGAAGAAGAEATALEAEAGAGAGAAGAGAAGGPWGLLGAMTAYMTYKQLAPRHKKQVGSFLGGLLAHFTPFKAVGTGVNALMGGHPLGAVLNVLKNSPIGYPMKWLGIGHTGGLVTPHGIRRYQFGGPVDNVLGWLQPGEGVLNSMAMSNIGTGGLAALNAGYGLGGMNIQPSPAYFYIDGRQIARAMIAYTLQAASRGPSTLVGGSLATGVGSSTGLGV